MTSNQQRAVAMAQRILDEWEAPHEVNDADWSLLLLAAGLNNFRSLPLTVAARVLDRYERHAGYFAIATRPRLDPSHAAHDRHSEAVFSWIRA